jgi:glucosamine--fructose-6-phosphate aminotransferase (isomerizing)
MTGGALMAAEMAEQPAVLASLARRRPELVERVRDALPPGLAGTVLLARGSSDNAAVYGRYLLELATGRPVALAAPSLHTLYDVEVDYRGYLVVAVSQSGRTPEIVSVLDRLRAAGAHTVAITNAGESPLARAADAVIDLAAGEERAVPATKTVSAQLAALAIVAEAAGKVPWSATDWQALAEAAETILGDGEAARYAAEQLAGASGLAVVARGYLYCVALETALKLKETTSLQAQGYSAADFRHGPIATVDEGFPVILFSVAGPAAPDMAELLYEVRRRGGRAITIGDAPGSAVSLPADVPEPLAPIVAVLRGQQIAAALADRLGIDPDTPFGLRKVTETT